MSNVTLDIKSPLIPIKIKNGISARLLLSVLDAKVM